MRRLLFVLVLTMLPGLTFAADSKSKFQIFGFYGLGMVNPADINNLQKQFTAPKPNDILTGTMFGGGLGINFGPKVVFKVRYDMFEGKNLATDNDGYTLTQNMIWGDLDVMLAQGKTVYVYAGAGAGYPLTSTAKRVVSGVATNFDGDKNIAANAQLGLGFMLGNHFSLFFQAEYQYNFTGTLKNGSTPLTYNGRNATLDLSGPKGMGGLAIMF